MKLDSKHEAAQAYVDAANAYKKGDSEAAIASLERAVDAFIDMGRLAMAAKHYKDIAEQYEQQSTGDDEEAKKACEFYQKAADLYQDEEQTSSANQCYLKFAQYSAALGDYKSAISCYESVARKSLDNNLLKYSVKEYLFNAGMCQILLTNVEQARDNIERYVFD